MFTDFNKVFNNKKNDPVQIPEIILQQLNKPLKNGLRYIDNGNGTCSIVSDSEMKIGGIEIIIDEEMPGMMKGRGGKMGRFKLPF